MFKSIRRNSRNFFEPVRRKSVATIDTPPSVADKDEDVANTSTLTFFSLPAEIRNSIYELVAADTTITIIHVSPLALKPPKQSRKPSLPTPITSRAKSTPAPVPPLLLTSRQTRSEFLPLLLSLAPLTATVKDFDFRALTRTLSSLYATELRALRENPRILIRLQIEKISRENFTGLSRWITKRANSSDRIPLRYTIFWPKDRQFIPTSNQVHRINVYIQRRNLLNQGLHGMAGLRREVGETVGFELDGMVDAFKKELEVVRAMNLDLSDGVTAWQEDARMLMYGMPTARPYV